MSDLVEELKILPFLNQEIPEARKTEIEVFIFYYSSTCHCSNGTFRLELEQITESRPAGSVRDSFTARKMKKQ